MSGLALIGLGAGIAPLGLLLLLIVAITGGRNEPDPDAERPRALYYSGVFFITVFTALFALFTVAASLMNLTTHDRGDSFGFGESQSVETQTFSVGGETQVVRPAPSFSQLRRAGENDADYANALRGAVIGAVAIGVYLWHERRRRDQLRGPVGARVERTYFYAVAFTSVVIFVIAGGVALYAIVQMLAPGVTHADTRADAAVVFGQAGFLALLAGALFMYHLNEADGLPGRARHDRGASSLLVPEPPPPVLPDEEFAPPRPARAPRKAVKKAAKKTAAKKRT